MSIQSGLLCAQLVYLIFTAILGYPFYGHRGMLSPSWISGTWAFTAVIVVLWLAGVK